VLHVVFIEPRTPSPVCACAARLCARRMLSLSVMASRRWRRARQSGGAIRDLESHSYDYAFIRPVDMVACGALGQ